MIEIICRFEVFLVLSALCLWQARLGSRHYGSLLLVALWAINWLSNHISLRWLSYLRYGFWVTVVAAIVLVPQSREIVLGLGNIFFGGLPP